MARLQGRRQPGQAAHVQQMEFPRQLVDNDGPGRRCCEIPIEEASQPSGRPNAITHAYAVVHGEPVGAVTLTHATKITSRVRSTAEALRTGLQYKY